MSKIKGTGKGNQGKPDNEDNKAKRRTPRRAKLCRGRLVPSAIIEVISPEEGKGRIRKIKNFPSYLVEIGGRVFSIGRSRKEGIRELIFTPDSGGYPTVTLCEGGRRKTVRVHKAVQDTYLPPPTKGQQCLHRNDDKRNPGAANLYNGTAADNAADRARNGKTVRGEQVHSAKLSEAKVRTIRRSKKSAVALSKLYNVTPSAVGKARNRITWKHLR